MGPFRADKKRSSLLKRWSWQSGAWTQGWDPFLEVFSWTGFTFQLGWKGKNDPTPALVQDTISSCLSPPFYCSFSPLVFARHPRCTFQHHDGNVRKRNLWFPGVWCTGEWTFCRFRICFHAHFQSVRGDSYEQLVFWNKGRNKWYLNTPWGFFRSQDWNTHHVF